MAIKVKKPAPVVKATDSANTGKAAVAGEKASDIAGDNTSNGGNAGENTSNDSKTSNGSNSDIKKHIAPYLKDYPKENVFYIASDMQVFLEASKAEAEAHQLFLGDKGELQRVAR